MKKIFTWIKSLFKNIRVTAELYVKPSIQIVDALKNAVNSPVIPIVTALIPGTLDDYIINKLSKVLPKVIKALHIAECSSNQDPHQLMLCIIENVKKYEPIERAVTYHSFAALLSVYLSDGKITWSEAVHLTEYLYKGNDISN